MKRKGSFYYWLSYDSFVQYSSKLSLFMLRFNMRLTKDYLVFETGTNMKSFEKLHKRKFRDWFLEEHTGCKDMCEMKNNYSMNDVEYLRSRLASFGENYENSTTYRCYEENLSKCNPDNIYYFWLQTTHIFLLPK